MDIINLLKTICELATEIEGLIESSGEFFGNIE